MPKDVGFASDKHLVVAGSAMIASFDFCFVVGRQSRWNLNLGSRGIVYIECHDKKAFEERKNISTNENLGEHETSFEHDA